jgi:hypothetical protein
MAGIVALLTTKVRALRGGALARRARVLCGDSAGQAAILTALALVPMVGMVGLGVDAAQMVMLKRDLRNAADMGAQAGALAKISSQDVTTSVKKAVGYNAKGAITYTAIEATPSTGPGKNDPYAVRVSLNSVQTLPFMGIFMNKSVALNAEATASAFAGAANCVVAMDSSNTSALAITGSASLTMKCGAASNSKATGALAATGQYIDVPTLYTAGTVTRGNGITSTTTIAEKMFALPDPLGALPNPSPSCGATQNYWTKNNFTETIGPGCYSSLRSSGDLTLSPGIYYIMGGDVQVDANAKLRGSGVTLIFLNQNNPSSPGKFTAAGTSTIQLSASTSGTYAGILMYQQRTAAYNNQTTFTVTGDNTSSFQGAIYVKGSMVRFTGNSGMSTPCMQIAARYVTFGGNTNVTNTCPSSSGAGAFNGKLVRLIG